MIVEECNGRVVGFTTETRSQEENAIAAEKKKGANCVAPFR